MGIQIVTGYTGTAHIKSAHDRTRNAGVVGTGSYVLKVGNQLAARMQSANTLRIVDGDLMMQGVHATIEAGTHEDLTVENGTQGMKRNDIVVARYERLSGEPKTESVKLKVIKGAPSASEPEDPKHAEGDILKGDLVAEMPLYRVPIDGIAPGTPVPLFETVPTIDELRDSVSQDTGHVALLGRIPSDDATADTNGVWYRKVGHIVWVHVLLGGTTGVTIDQTFKTLAKLPPECRPRVPFFMAAWTPGQASASTQVKILTDGSIQAASSTKTQYVRSYGCFHV